MNAITSFRGGYSFLSNFYPCEFEFEGEVYKSVEHFFHAVKTHNPLERQRVINAETPALAKRLGRRVTLRKDWPEVKEWLMLEGLMKKFSDPKLKRKLILTSPSTLVEGNMWHDMYWGACFCSKHRGAGKNVLGKLLMEVRENAR